MSGLDIHGFSEQGPRADNQDAIDIGHFSDRHVLVLADGMGGHRGGRAAADLAISSVLDATPIRNHAEARRALERADRAVRERSESDPDLAGMGAAAALLARVRARDGSEGWIAAHVGDVRIVSRSPDGVVRLETRDHTPAFLQWEEGQIGLDEIPDARGANRLQRSLGHGGVADAVWIPLAPGWRYAIVSDGVTKAMRLDELGRALAAPSAEAASAAIRTKVEERGPDDNFSAVVAIASGAHRAAPAADPDTTMVPDDSTQTHQPATPGHALPPEERSAPRGGALWIALFVALAAALLGAWALWEARDLRLATDRIGDQVELMREEMDSLRVELRQATDVFGPETSPVDEPEPEAP